MRVRSYVDQRIHDLGLPGRWQAGGFPLVRGEMGRARRTIIKEQMLSAGLPV
jgi:hypothetical protein